MLSRLDDRCDASRRRTRQRLRWPARAALFSCAILSALVGTTRAAEPTVPASAPAAGRARNVILMIMDGCGASHLTLTRWYKGKPLALDEILVGGVRTYGSNSVIPDSAPAGTAMACGVKTSTSMIALTAEDATMPGLPQLPQAQRCRPVATVLEAAKGSGRAVGLATTVNLQHATPAAFSAHWHERMDYCEIGLQQVHLGLDVVLAGGWKYLVPRQGKVGGRGDGLNLMDLLKEQGYQFATDRAEMRALRPGKAWCMLGHDHLFCEFDRRRIRPDQPSLAEMTEKAIELLAPSPKGFFLMVEGGKIDWASHVNDPVGVISETLGFDEAVGVALKFARADGNTLLIACGDHGNGGLSIGKMSTPMERMTMKYAATAIDELLQPLRKATLTGEGVEMALAGDYSPANIRRTVEKYQGIELSEDELTELRMARIHKMNEVLGPIFTKRTILGWTTDGHTGEDLFLYAFGPGKPTGLLENTQIADAMARAMDLDLKKTTDELFAPWPEVAAAAGLTLPPAQPAERTVPFYQAAAETKRTIDRPGKPAIELIYHTDRIRVGGKEHRVGGVIIHAPLNGQVYLPRSAAAVLKNALQD